MSRRQRKYNTNRIRKHLDQRVVLRLEMAILVSISIIAVTIAWFVLQNHVWGKGIDLTISNDEYLIVALETGGDDVLDLQAQGSPALVSVQLPDYYNIENGKLAPGASGQMDFYVTSKSPITTDCYLYADILPVFADEFVISPSDTPQQAQEKSEQQAIIQALLEGHIQFYQHKEVDEQTGQVTYSNRIQENERFHIELEQDVEKKVTIYWVWFYQYVDVTNAIAKTMQTQTQTQTISGIGDTITISWTDPVSGTVTDEMVIPQKAENFFDFHSYGEVLSIQDPTEAQIQEYYSDNYASQDELLEYVIAHYDYGDTRIGQGVKHISFRVMFDTLYEP